MQQAQTTNEWQMRLISKAGEGFGAKKEKSWNCWQKPQLNLPSMEVNSNYATQVTAKLKLD